MFVVATSMSGEPDWVSPLVAVNIPGLVRPEYRAFPLVDHIADKLCATIMSHDSTGQNRASSRVKDLVDIALIALTQSIDGPALRAAVLAGVAHQGLTLPRHFTVPDLEAWRAGYPRKAAEAPGSPPEFDDAVSIAEELLNPVLAGPVTGKWNATLRHWQP